MTTGFTIAYDSAVTKITSHCAVSVGRAAPSDAPLLELDAIWDTGARMTTISYRVAQMLGLSGGKKTTVNSIGGAKDFESYSVNIIIPTGLCVTDVQVLCGDLRSCDVLIGMDIIQMGDFAISNAGGKTTFTFRILPDESAVDFAKPFRESHTPRSIWRWLVTRVLRVRHP